MTSLAVPAQPGQGSTSRPVPWRQLAWVSWRQSRATLIGAAVFLGTLALYMLVMGLKIRSAYAGVTACHPASSQTCLAADTVFNNVYWPTAEVLVGVLQAVPVLVGVFAGAPIIASELATGTFRFTWTQGAGRLRWTIARLALPAVAVTAAAAAFSQLFGWYFHPFFAAGLDSPFAAQFFDLTGFAFAAWTIAAFTIGALGGLLIRRVVPAISASMAVWAGLLLATLLYLRRHYLAPLTAKSGGPPAIGGPPPWVISQWWTGPNGKPVSEVQMIPLLQGPAGARHGYTLWTIYQPATRYWHFQLIEGGWLLALSLLLIAATIWLVRRRPA